MTMSVVCVGNRQVRAMADEGRSVADVFVPSNGVRTDKNIQIAVVIEVAEDFERVTCRDHSWLSPRPKTIRVFEPSKSVTKRVVGLTPNDQIQVLVAVEITKQDTSVTRNVRDVDRFGGERRGRQEDSTFALFKGKKASAHLVCLRLHDGAGLGTAAPNHEPLRLMDCKLIRDSPA